MNTLTLPSRSSTPSACLPGSALFSEQGLLNERINYVIRSEVSVVLNTIFLAI